MLERLAVLNGWIDAKTARITELAAATPVSKRLQTMPGVGPLVAMAVETFAPDMTSFHNGRDFAAWLGLVPRQFSRSEEHTSELQSIMRISYAVFCLKKKNRNKKIHT